METSSLIAAHQGGRRAESLLRRGKFEEAAKCHEEVASLLAEKIRQMKAMHPELNPRASKQGAVSIKTSPQFLMSFESLTLQQDYHNRQANVVRMRKARCERYRAMLETLKWDILNAQKVNKKVDEDYVNSISADEHGLSLGQEIYRVIEEEDSILNVLGVPPGKLDEEKLLFEHPEKTVLVIKEFRNVRSLLKSVTESIHNHTEKKKERIQELTKELHALTTGSSEEICTDDSHSLHLAPLPPLTPLEIPQFDFSSS